MRNIILAVTIAVGVGTALSLLSWALGLPADVIKSVAGVSALSIQKIYDLLEASSAKRALAKSGSSQTISANEFRPLTAFLFSFIFWFGAYLFSGTLMGFLLVLAEDASKTNLAASQPSFVLYTALPLRLLAAAYIGRWIGTRSRRYVLVIVAGAIALATVADFVMSLLFMNTDEAKPLYGDRTLLELIVLMLLPDMVLFMISGALGFWFGQRKKLAYHLAFVMKTVPEETSQLIVEMAQDEAMRAGRRAVQPSS